MLMLLVMVVLDMVMMAVVTRISMCPGTTRTVVVVVVADRTEMIHKSRCSSTTLTRPGSPAWTRNEQTLPIHFCPS